MCAAGLITNGKDAGHEKKGCGRTEKWNAVKPLLEKISQYDRRDKRPHLRRRTLWLLS